MKGKKKIIIIAVAVVLVLAAVGAAVFFLLPKEEAGEEEKPEEIQVDFPAVYQLNEIEIPAIQVIREEPESTEESAESDKAEKTDEGKDKKDPENTDEEEAEPQEEDPNRPTCEQERISATYVYHNFPKLQESLTNYIREMTSRKGYFAVDENMVKKKATPAEKSEGTCSLARTGDKEGMIVLVEITWSDPECNVEVSYIPGEIKEPKRPETTSYLEMKQSITILQAKEFIWSLHPSVLGLEGDSMSDYRIYTTDVDVIVNGYPCIRLNIFSNSDQTGTNEVAGEYCLSRNGENLYRIVENSNKVQKIELPEGVSIKTQ